MKNTSIAIMLANASIAKLYHFDQSSKKLEELTVIEHPESKMKPSELKSDEPGRYQKSANPNEGSYAETTDPKEMEAKRFADEVCELLNKASHENDFSKLYFIAPGNFQSHIKKNAKEHLLKKVHFIDKDYTKLGIKKLEEYISEIVNNR